MGIQSSVNNLLAQVQRLATFYVGKDKVDQITGDTTATKNEAQIQTEIASGNAPMKDGKVDPEWLQKRRDEISKILFYPNGKLSTVGEARARILELNRREGFEIGQENKNFLNDLRVQDYLKTVNDKKARFESALNTLESSISPELQNKVAEKVARASVEARTASINQSKADFDEHAASLIKYYSKGSGNP